MTLEELTVSALNVNSINTFKHKALRSVAKEADIFCMLDTKHTEKSQYRFNFPNKNKFSSPGEQLRAKGILIFYNKELTPTFNEIVNGQLVEMNFVLKKTKNLK